jgi:hypothetical protein
MRKLQPRRLRAERLDDYRTKPVGQLRWNVRRGQDFARDSLKIDPGVEANPG